ncbi:MAG TPA: hypothetical protein VIL49_15490, partial [Capillimicrobium sp.]
MLRTSLALITAALALATAPAVASAQDDLRVFFPGNCERNSYKPKAVQVFCADGGMRIAGIKYSSYGSDSAVGSGVATVNLCEPDCAAGNTEKYDADLRMSRVRQCGDVPQFTRLRVTFPDGAPKGFRKGVTQRFGC